MDQILEIYNQFLSYFPAGSQWLVSVVLACLLVLAIYKVIKKNFIYIVLLIIILPASVPIFKDVWQNLLALLKFLLTKR
jgi:hypothetical protein